jgi:hypothetical protein
MRYSNSILVYPAPEALMDIDLAIGGLVSFGGVYMVYRTTLAEGDITMVLKLFAYLSTTAAFLCNTGIAFLLANRGGFLFDSGSAEAWARNSLWFDRPDRFVVVGACLILNLGYLIAFGGRWRGHILLLWSILNIVAIIFFHTLVTDYILRG